MFLSAGDDALVSVIVVWLGSIVAGEVLIWLAHMWLMECAWAHGSSGVDGLEIYSFDPWLGQGMCLLVCVCARRHQRTWWSVVVWAYVVWIRLRHFLRR